MNQNTLGKLLEETREKRKISKVNLCHGLCSVTALTRYELDIRIPDKFLADALLERLGLNPYRYEFISSDLEFAYSLIRTQIETFLYYNQTDEACLLLEDYEKRLRKSDFLHKQYILLMKAVLLGKSCSYEEGISLILEALLCTDCEESRFFETRSILLTDIEMKLIYMQAKYLYYVGNKMESYSMFDALRQYIDKMNWDDEKLKEYYPHIMYRLSQQEIEAHNYGKAYDYLKRAEEILMRNYKLDNLFEILDLKHEVLIHLYPEATVEVNKNFIQALKIISTSQNGKITEKGVQIWENTVNQQL